MAPSEILIYRTGENHNPTDEELQKIPVTNDSGIVQVDPGKGTEVSTPISGKVIIGCSRDNQFTNVIFEKGRKILLDSPDWFPVPATSENSLGLRVLVRHVTVPNLKIGKHMPPETLYRAT